MLISEKKKKSSDKSSSSQIDFLCTLFNTNHDAGRKNTGSRTQSIFFLKKYEIEMNYEMKKLDTKRSANGELK